MDKIEAYGYIRVSGSGQVEKDGPKRQRDSITGFLVANKLEFRGWFEDLAVSGTVEGMDRPGFHEMISYCELHDVRIIVVEKLDRFARDLMVQEMLMRELRNRGIRLFSTELGFVDQVTNESDPSRTLIRQIFGAVAQYDKTSLVIKLRCARQRVKREKGRCEGRSSYGNISARATNESLVLRSREEKKILEFIVELVEIGSSYSTIAQLLTQAGFRNRAGVVKWDKPQLYRIYRNYKRNIKQQEKQNGHMLEHGSSGDEPQDGSGGERSGELSAEVPGAVG